ncbi:uncharacterized protein LOC129600211 isoform X2 [Paramacrobiotus metropolitanus]|uniref:uncharacterized protein LOC129600211 isoform X2 n=1 Tax=Paramacrobiotus metropolitanus TaxID=2943436 RepID=UPI0024464947|nr:uncharacterized protein LOC129600211 isoform X2 [Paramacrobiotus metropolitanus]
MMNRPWWLIIILIHHCYRVAADDGGDYNNLDLVPVPFPIFSAEPMAQEQCRLQFTDNCQSWATTVENCPTSPILQINCNSSATSHEIQQMAIGFAKPPLRAVWVTINDSDHVAFDTFAPVRQQIVGFSLYNCTSIRATGKISSFRLSNVLDLYVESCYNLKIRRGDFWHSLKVRQITFAKSTIQSLEKLTFTDLPALRLLSLENGFAQMPVFSTEIRAYLKELHCGAVFEWFREWWENKHLMKSLRATELYQIHPFPDGNDAKNKSDIYLPVDCAAKPFPTGTSSIDFKQERFSVNDDLYKETRQPGNPDNSDTDDRYPEFSAEPLSAEECATQELSSSERHNCTADSRLAYEVLEQGDDNNSSAVVNRIHRAVNAMTRLPIRPVIVDLQDRAPLAFTDMAPIRKRIVVFWLSECVNERVTRKLHDLYWTNLMEFVTFNCSDLVIMKNDFANSLKLRQIMFVNTTIRTLEENTFANLPSLVALSLQHRLKNLRSYDEEMADPRAPVMFTQRILDYLFRLHCGCEFAWFRRWWSNNTARLTTPIADDGGVYHIFGGIFSFTKYARDHISIDCAKPIPLGAEFIANQSEFSINALEC